MPLLFGFQRFLADVTNFAADFSDNFSRTQSSSELQISLVDKKSEMKTIANLTPSVFPELAKRELVGTHDIHVTT